MLVFLFVSFLSSIILFEFFYFPLFLLSSLLLFYLSFSSMSSYCIFVWVLSDSYSLLLVFLTVFVLYSAYLFTTSFPGHFLIGFIFYCMFIPCFFVFSSSNFLVLYSFYELSLVPIIFIIVKWGSYPERSLSALMLLLYTSLFSFPLIGGLFLIYSNSMTFLLPLSCVSLSSDSFILSVLIFLSFSVKLPIYGLHFWLPIAHVEAPTFGSIILAGVLLKLGGAGLVRFLALVDVSVFKSFILAYSLVFLVFSSFLCCLQSDFKRLVAYSSVSHMIAVPILILACSSLSAQSILLLIVFHGLSSPVLFSIVGLLYSLYSTRQLALIRGLLLLSPIFSFLCIISFLFTLSAPPYPSFFSEVLFFLSSLDLTSFVLLPFLVFAIISLVYNLNWLSSILFNTHFLASPFYSFLNLHIFFIIDSHF